MTAAGIPPLATITVPDGEEVKTLATVERIYNGLLDAGAERSTAIFALGGGVVGDMAGFAAATYLRGVPFVQVPTTLLAQVDASVGGKTGVNLPRGKNLVGAFYQPEAVLVDTATLGTLPERELRAGLAEVIKYGLIRDPGFFGWLEHHLQALLDREPDPLAEAIRRSCRNKAEVVADDERENGQRALLNLGHTFAHAIEAGTGYSPWLHGEAVAVGLVMAAEASWRLGRLSEADRDRTRALVEQAGLPTWGPSDLPVDRYLALMAVDKKVAEGRVRFVLLDAVGEALVTDDVPEEVLRDAIAACTPRGSG